MRDGTKKVTTVLPSDADALGNFLASHGGPFFDLQRRLNLLHDSALQVEKRAAIFVLMAWGAPLMLSLLQGHAYGPVASQPYLLDAGAWARFVVAIALFVLSEKLVEDQLHSKLAQFTRAPLIEPSSFAAAATAVATALKRRNDRTAEFMCLIIAVMVALGSYLRFNSTEASSWAVQVSSTGRSFTLAGWWALLISGPLFGFLFLRGLWRHLVWSLLLRRIASLELRLVASHPDGKGGLAFIADYPNAYALSVFGISSAAAVALAQTAFEDGISAHAFGIVLALWLALVLALFAYPLQAFSRPLTALKKLSLLSYGAQATRFYRLEERRILGSNLLAGPDRQDGQEDEVADPSKQFAAAKKLSTVLMSRSAVIPVAAAALLPFALVGAKQLPVEEILSVLKKLVLI